jgi:hypothetical protein
MEQYKVTEFSIVLEGKRIRPESEGYSFLMANVNLE